MTYVAVGNLCAAILDDSEDQADNRATLNALAYDLEHADEDDQE